MPGRYSCRSSVVNHAWAISRCRCGELVAFMRALNSSAEAIKWNHWRNERRWWEAESSRTCTKGVTSTVRMGNRSSIASIHAWRISVTERLNNSEKRTNDCTRLDRGVHRGERLRARHLLGFERYRATHCNTPASSHDACGSSSFGLAPVATNRNKSAQLFPEFASR